MAEAPTERLQARLLAPRWNRIAPAITLLGGISALAFSRIHSHPVLLWSILGALILAILGVFWAQRSQKTIEIEWDFRHGLPIIAHGLIYTYWAWHWSGVLERLPLILVQIPIAYLLDMTYGWRRYGRFRLGLAPVLIVSNLNLFLWMKDDLFGIQLLMLFLTYGGRAFLRWSRGGHRIFNPPALALAGVSIALILGGWSEWAQVGEVAGIISYGPLSYAVIFIAGLLIQVRFPVVLTTMAAFVSTLLMGMIWQTSHGGYYFVDTMIPVTIFLGLTVLITDPVTLPKTGGGKLTFGVLYGVGVFGLHALLMGAGELPWEANLAYFGALLWIPVLNILVPLIDRIGAQFSLSGWADQLGESKINQIYMGVWAAVFVSSYGALVDSPGRSVGYWQEACEVRLSDALCDRMVIGFNRHCRNGDPTARPTTCGPAIGLVLERECTANVETSCADLGRLLLRGTPDLRAHPAQGRALLKRACLHGVDSACGQLGSVYFRGERIKRDLKTALPLLNQGCDGGVQIACEQFGLALREAGESARSLDVLTKACAQNMGIACATGGMMHLQAKRPDLGLKMLDQACKLGIKNACTMLSRSPPQ